MAKPEEAWALSRHAIWKIEADGIHVFELDGKDPSWRNVPISGVEQFVDPMAGPAADGIVLIDRMRGKAALLRTSLNAPNSLLALPDLPAVDQVHAVAAARGIGYWVAATERNGSQKGGITLLGMQEGAASWEEIARLEPGSGVPQALAAQNDGVRVQVYVLGPTAFTILDSRSRQWRTLPSPPPAEPQAGRAPPSRPLLVPVGIAHLYLITAGTPARVSVFNTITRTWTTQRPWAESGTPVAFHSQGTQFSTLLLRDNGTPVLVKTEYTIRAHGLHRVDYVLMATFLVGLVTLAVLNRRRFKSADSYFRGGKNIPWLAAGLSVVATGQSATSFISIPARSFATNWQFALVPLTNVFGALIMSRYFVRFFVRLNITSGYEYLQVRFNPLVRTVGSLNYLCYELARISLLILVPAVAVSAVAKVDLHTAIITMGAVTTVYTSLGGLEGVVWADVIQISLKILAILLAAILIFAHLDGSVTELASTAWHSGKLRLVDWSFDFTRDTIWAFLLFWLTDGLKSYVANQTIIQRYVSTRDETAAKRSIRASAWVGTLISWTFLLTGTGLFLFYQQNPDRFDLTVDKADAVFPWFIVFELPPGVVGLLMTALIAAAFSSLYGALNSTSTVVVTDFYRRFSRTATDAGALRLGKRCTIVIGIVSTAISLTLAGLASRSLVEQTLSVIGLFGGGLGGLFLVGMLTTRVSARSALVGFVISAAVQYYVSRHTSLHWLTYMFTGMGSCFVAAYLASFIWPENRKLEGLTVHTYA
jgi:solute:Na+ symporter, SSS family